MIQTPEIFQRIYLQHGHRCPMSTLGGRMGLAALKALDAQEDNALSAVFEHGTCAVDGIEVATGCSRLSGSLRVEDFGRHTVVVQSAAGDSVRITLNAFALATAWEYRTAEAAYNAGEGSLPDAELQRLRVQKEAVLQTVLERLWTLPDESLLTLERS
jgi:formylmethanofuran dehydrogenase subunit E